MLVATNSNAVLIGIIATLIVILVLFQTSPNTIAQTDTSFTPADKFSIPSYNGTVSFAVNGTYANATLENDIWTFTNLRLNDSQPLKNLEISAQNSNVTILMVQVLNTTFQGALLSYIVEGRGTQTFNFDLNIEGAEWSVLFNGAFIAEGEGWTLSLDQTLTITGATGNVTLMCISLGGSGNRANLPFYQQHSVAIATAAAVAVMVVLAVGVRARRREHLAAVDW